MGIASETKLIVKHTFLEIVVDDTQAVADGPTSRTRSFTDGAIISKNGDISNIIVERLEHRPLPEEFDQAEGDLQDGCMWPLEEKTSYLAQCNTYKQVEDPCRCGSIFLEDAKFCQQCGSARPKVAMQSSPPMANSIAWTRSPAAKGNPSSVRSLATMVSSAPIGAAPGWIQTTNPVPNRASGNKAQASRSKVAKPGAAAGTPREEDYTTLMLRNLPNQYTRDMLLELLGTVGFAGKYTFVYLPIDFKTHAGLGYAFVDLVSREETDRMRNMFEGFSQWAMRSEKVCTVSWSHPEQQGFAAHVERYRNSPVMHESVPDEWKPAVFNRGVRMAFPEPTKKLRNPHIRNLYG
jgi:hypothetical protein